MAILTKAHAHPPVMGCSKRCVPASMKLTAREKADRRGGASPFSWRSQAWERGVGVQRGYLVRRERRNGRGGARSMPEAFSASSRPPHI